MESKNNKATKPVKNNPSCPLSKEVADSIKKVHADKLKQCSEGAVITK